MEMIAPHRLDRGVDNEAPFQLCFGYLAQHRSDFEVKELKTFEGSSFIRASKAKVLLLVLRFLEARFYWKTITRAPIKFSS